MDFAVQRREGAYMNSLGDIDRSGDRCEVRFCVDVFVRKETPGLDLCPCSVYVRQEYNDGEIFNGARAADVEEPPRSSKDGIDVLLDVRPVRV